MKYKIYKLIHPKLGIVYIGRTILTLEKRKACGYKACAVEHIANECEIIEIESTNDISREKYWIDYYGDKLMNLKKGDSGLDKKDYGKEYDKEYRLRNSDKIREHRIKNADKHKEYMKEYRLKRKEKL